jgi:hypothetical protein
VACESAQLRARTFIVFERVLLVSEEGLFLSSSTNGSGEEKVRKLLISRRPRGYSAGVAEKLGDIATSAQVRWHVKGAWAPARHRHDKTATCPRAVVRKRPNYYAQSLHEMALFLVDKHGKLEV